MANKIVIVKKKKGRPAGHHGGSWKVAYADFVTAMMAFFMVMWIMGMEQDVRDLVQGYFSNPIGYRKSVSGGLTITSRGTSIASIELHSAIMIRRSEEVRRMRAVAEDIRQELEDLGVLDDADARVETVLTEEGLRIEMMETSTGEETFFERSSATLKPALRQVLSTVSGQIARLDNGVIVEGHTDSVPFGSAGYSNWELSVDRANGARRALVEAGMPGSQLVEVRGYADRELKITDAPDDPRNRRISLLLPYDTPDPTESQRAIERAAGGESAGAAGAGR